MLSILRAVGALSALLLLQLAATSFGVVADTIPFENSAIVRTVELGGTLTYLSTTYAVRALKDDVSGYTLSLSEEEYNVTSWMQAKVKGQASPLQLSLLGYDKPNKSYKYQVSIPRMQSGDSLNLVIETVQTHAAHPWPASAPQTAPQLMRYYGHVFVPTPYFTKVQRTKYRGVSSFVDFTVPTGLDDFTLDATASRSGTTVTYGPYNDVPASVTREFAEKHQQRVELRYQWREPVLTITSLIRSAEISHWGSNLNIQDEIKLRNDGPTLKGQFSRVEYQKQRHLGDVQSSSVERITMHLPPGVRNPYYFDLNGNVSTSSFRPARAPVNAKTRSILYSSLELRPRYPLLGGWHYNFTVGWDAPLQDNARFDSASGRYIIGIPFWTIIPHAVVDEAETSIVLPEGAIDVEVYPPFSPQSMEQSTHITYLDTVGRPKITLKAKQITDRHNGIIYVAYKVPISAHFRKPLAIGVGTLGLFVFSFITRRLDLRLSK